MAEKDNILGLWEELTETLSVDTIRKVYKLVELSEIQEKERILEKYKVQVIKRLHKNHREVVRRLEDVQKALSNK